MISSKSDWLILISRSTYVAPMIRVGVVFTFTEMNSMLRDVGCKIPSTRISFLMARSIPPLEFFEVVENLSFLWIL